MKAGIVLSGVEPATEPGVYIDALKVAPPLAKCEHSMMPTRQMGPGMIERRCRSCGEHEYVEGNIPRDAYAPTVLWR